MAAPSAAIGAGSSSRPCFTGVEPDMRIAQEEIFGPVVAVIPYADEDDAVAIANNSTYGLNGAVFTTDFEHGCAGREPHPHRTSSSSTAARPASAHRWAG